MPKQSGISTVPKGSTKEFSVDELNKALFDFEDVMERAMCPFLLLGQTAWDVKSGYMLRGDKVEVGIQIKYLTPEVLSVIKSYKNTDLDLHVKRWTYLVEGVPIIVSLIKRNYKFFKNPETKIYWGGDYKLPNSMVDYWKARFIIR